MTTSGASLETKPNRVKDDNQRPERHCSGSNDHQSYRLGDRFPILFGVKDITPRVRVAPRFPPYPGCIGDGLEDAIVAFLSVSTTASLKESRLPVVYCDISFSFQNRCSVCSLLLEKKRKKKPPRARMKLLSALLAVASISLLQIARATPVARLEVPEGRVSKHLRPVLEKRDPPQFTVGQPVDGNGKGAPLSGKSLVFRPSNANLTSIKVEPTRRWTSRILIT